MRIFVLDNWVDSMIAVKENTISFEEIKKEIVALNLF